ncbi:MAG: hypothetical protein QW134_08805 [Nitrososphaeria archaeon]
MKKSKIVTKLKFLIPTVFIIFSFLFLFFDSSNVYATSKELEIHFINVKNGFFDLHSYSPALIIYPDGKTLLFNTGPSSASSK